MHSIERVTRGAINMVPFPFRRKERPLALLPEMDRFTGHIAIVGADFTHNSDADRVNAPLEVIHARQIAHTVERAADEVGADLIAVRPFVPSASINGMPGPVGRSAQRISDAFDIGGTEVELIDSPAQLHVGEEHVDNAHVTLEQALTDFSESDQAQGSHPFFVAVMHPEVGKDAFAHVHRDQLIGGGVMTLASVVHHDPRESLWLPRN